MTPPWSAGEEAVVPVANCASGAPSGERRSPQLTREPSRVPRSLKKKKATGDLDRVRFRLAATFIDQTSIKNDG
jgi:hypothetical protein